MEETVAGKKVSGSKTAIQKRFPRQFFRSKERHELKCGM